MGISTDDLNRWVENNPTPEDEDAEENQDDDDGEDSENVEPKIKHEDAIKHFEICIQWGQQNDIDDSKSMVLRELQECAMQKKISIPKKQSLLDQLFK